MFRREEIIYYLEVVLPANNPVYVYIADRNIVDSVYDLYQRSNWVISDFRVCDSSTLDMVCTERIVCICMDVSCGI